MIGARRQGLVHHVVFVGRRERSAKNSDKKAGVPLFKGVTCARRECRMFGFLYRSGEGRSTIRDM